MRKSVPRTTVALAVQLTVQVGEGRNLRVGEGTFVAGTKGRVGSPEWAPAPAGYTALNLNGTTVGVRNQGGEAGGLARIHVEALPVVPAQGAPPTLCMAIYEEIDSPAAMEMKGEWRCIQCGGVVVCGAAPRCL